MAGHAEDVQVAVADLEGEQDIEPLQRGAVDVEEVHSQHRGGLGAQELASAHVGGPRRRRCDPVAAQDPADRRGADAVAEFEQFVLNPAVAQLGFSFANRSTNAATTSLIGGRPGRWRRISQAR
jgi:hypothetical protein